MQRQVEDTRPSGGGVKAREWRIWAPEKQFHYVTILSESPESRSLSY